MKKLRRILAEEGLSKVGYAPREVPLSRKEMEDMVQKVVKSIRAPEPGDRIKVDRLPPKKFTLPGMKGPEYDNVITEVTVSRKATKVVVHIEMFATWYKPTLRLFKWSGKKKKEYFEPVSDRSLNYHIKMALFQAQYL